MKSHIQYSPWTNLYDATLLGGEFDNCHGQGPTPEQAEISLKLTVNVRRRQWHARFLNTLASSFNGNHDHE